MNDLVLIAGRVEPLAMVDKDIYLAFEPIDTDEWSPLIYLCITNFSLN